MQGVHRLGQLLHHHVKCNEQERKLLEKRWSLTNGVIPGGFHRRCTSLSHEWYWWEWRELVRKRCCTTDTRILYSPSVCIADYLARRRCGSHSASRFVTTVLFWSRVHPAWCSDTISSLVHCYRWCMMEHNFSSVLWRHFSSEKDDR